MQTFRTEGLELAALDAATAGLAFDRSVRSSTWMQSLESPASSRGRTLVAGERLVFCRLQGMATRGHGA
jgi:hypothetical protein